MEKFQNEFQKEISKLKEGELIIAVRVGDNKENSVVYVNNKIDDCAQSIALSMLAHGIYVATLKKAEKHGVPTDLGKMLAWLPITAAFATVKAMKDNENLLDELKIQMADDNENDADEPLKDEDEPTKEDIDEIMSHLTPDEQKLLTQLICSIVLRGTEEENE